MNRYRTRGLKLRDDEKPKLLCSCLWRIIAHGGESDIALDEEDQSFSEGSANIVND